MDRKEFIKKSCTYCIGAIGLGFLVTELSSCSSTQVYKSTIENGSIAVPVSTFGESNMLVVRNIKLEYDILLVKKSAQEYNALYMKCTHQDNPLTAGSKGLYCASHGSSFDLEGNVLKAPANQALRKFKTEVINNHIYINLKS
jgi:Rieske Fe-S protein